MGFGPVDLGSTGHMAASPQVGWRRTDNAACASNFME
jgi:hypothetical protein